MQVFREFFPLGKAYGEAFCNREEETAQLVGNIKSGKHVLLIAPRRFGKSSLAEKAIEKSKCPSLKINLHLATSEEDVVQLILDGIVEFIGIAVGRAEKWMASIRKYLTNLEPSLSFGEKIAQLKLVPKKRENYAVAISEALLLMEKLLREKKKRAVIFFDEFQEIDRLDEQHGIEGAIRTAAQEMQYLSIIFSGSIRSLLLSMFEDENKPLYKLCRKIRLERIGASDYEKHIQKIARNTWGYPLDSVVFDRIMTLSNRHPYYVNYLCDSVWELYQHLPKLEEIDVAWRRVIAEEWSDALRELAVLPPNQRRLLKFIANYEVVSLQSQETSMQLAMPTSSIASAAHVLIEKDYLEQNADGTYLVINPLLLAVLRGAQD